MAIKISSFRHISSLKCYQFLTLDEPLNENQNSECPFTGNLHLLRSLVAVFLIPLTLRLKRH